MTVRYAILADIHGNKHALDAVLEWLRGVDIDGYLVAGDLVGYGPFPNECVERVAELGAICVAGNHDLIALGRLGDERCIPLAQRSLAWTRSVLGEDVRTYLEALPDRVNVAGGVLMTHGTLDHAWEYTTRPDQAAAQLARLPVEAPGATTLVVGHTHRARAWDEAGRPLPRGRARLELPVPVLVNPGAIGQSRDLRVRACFLLLDTDARTAEFHAIRYDTRACREALRRQGLSSRSHHLRPRMLGAGRALRRMLRRPG
jgi:predicted phosphodiesterase